MATASVAPRRSFTATTFAAGFLALLGLGAAGVGVHDYQHHQRHMDETRNELSSARATLDKVRFDEKGNVVADDRSDYLDATLTLKSGTESLRTFQASQTNTYPFMGGGLAAFLLFAVLAVRSTKNTV
ncbi:MAG: hypothetical protein HOW73_12055 [Polyangiaceae bacterium]|nr:hypothetical protein [Polyangiaceae bacterium]